MTGVNCSVVKMVLDANSHVRIVLKVILMNQHTLSIVLDNDDR